MNLQSGQGSVVTAHLCPAWHQLEQLKGGGASSLTCLAVDAACPLGSHLEAVAGTSACDFSTWWLGLPHVMEAGSQGARRQAEAVSPL